MLAIWGANGASEADTCRNSVPDAERLPPPPPGLVALPGTCVDGGYDSSPRFHVDEQTGEPVVLRGGGQRPVRLTPAVAQMRTHAGDDRRRTPGRARRDAVPLGQPFDQACADRVRGHVRSPVVRQGAGQERV